jgi:cell division protein FtsB
MFSDTKKSKAYEKLDKQEEKIEERKKKLKSAEMEQMIRSIVRSELARSRKGK